MLLDVKAGTGFGGAAEFAKFVGWSNFNNGSGTGAPIVLPAGTQVGDLAFAFGIGGGPSLTGGTAANWTRILAAGGGLSGSSAYGMWCKQLDASDLANMPTIASGSFGMTVVLVWRGATTATSKVQPGTSASQVLTLSPGFSKAPSSKKVIAFGFTRTDGGSAVNPTTPADWIQQYSGFGTYHTLQVIETENYVDGTALVWGNFATNYSQVRGILLELT